MVDLENALGVVSQKYCMYDLYHINRLCVSSFVLLVGDALQHTIQLWLTEAWHHQSYRENVDIDTTMNSSLPPITRISVRSQPNGRENSGAQIQLAGGPSGLRVCV